MTEQWHILPQNDLREHEDKLSCWCYPLLTSEGVIIHNALDEREKYETGERKTN